MENKASQANTNKTNDIDSIKVPKLPLLINFDANNAKNHHLSKKIINQNNYLELLSRQYRFIRFHKDKSFRLILKDHIPNPYFVGPLKNAENNAEENGTVKNGDNGTNIIVNNNKRKNSRKRKKKETKKRKIEIPLLHSKYIEGSMTVVGVKGYRMARASYGVSVGTEWFFEFFINDNDSTHIDEIWQQKSKDTPSIRLGVATIEANLESPVGFDRFGYSYCSKTGNISHGNKQVTYGEPFGPGDVIGLYIRLPPFEGNDILSKMKKERRDADDDSHIKRLERQLIHKTQMIEEGYSMHSLKGSQISFYKNGVSQGVAFENIFAATYMPAVSLYMNASVTLNVGPNFKYPINFKPQPFNKTYNSTLANKKIDEQVNFLLPSRLILNKVDDNLLLKLPDNDKYL